MPKRKTNAKSVTKTTRLSVPQTKTKKVSKKSSSHTATVLESSAKAQIGENLKKTEKSVGSLRVKRRSIILGAIVIALIGLLVYYRHLFVVALVNGQPITRLSYIQETESVYIPDARVTAGKQALNQIITKTLIYQEAKRRNISVTEKEVNDEVAKTRKNLEKSGQKLETALELQGDSLEAYQERIKLQKLLEKLVGNISISDKEITDYIEKNKDALGQEISEEELKKQVSESLKQQKFNEKIQSLLQNLQQKAKITYFIKQ